MKDGTCLCVFLRWDVLICTHFRFFFFRELTENRLLANFTLAKFNSTIMINLQNQTVAKSDNRHKNGIH